MVDKKILTYCEHFFPLNYLCHDLFVANFNTNLTAESLYKCTHISELPFFGGFFFLKLFFLCGQALPPPPLLVAGPLKKDFFCGFP